MPMGFGVLLRSRDTNSGRSVAGQQGAKGRQNCVKASERTAGYSRALGCAVYAKKQPNDDHERNDAHESPGDRPPSPDKGVSPDRGHH